jgi:hypothetical protein
MRPSLRFLAIAIVGWAGVRAASLGTIPGADLFKIERARPTVPPVAPTQFPPIEPVAAAAPVQPDPYPQYMPAAYPYYGQPPMRPVLVPVYYPAPISTPVPSVRSSNMPPPQRSYYYPSDESRDEWPLPQLAGISAPARPSAVPQEALPPPPVPPIDPRRLDRLQLTSWALLRSQQTGVAGSRSLATGGQLGASQAGARLIYNFNRQLSLAARMSSEVGRRGGEVAGGVRIQPLVSIPVWVTAERRQAIGRYGGGRNAFALFAEGGLYGRPLPWGFGLDSYLQGGVVGMRSRDWFVDGSLAVSRPVYRQFSAGFGVWGGGQPGLYRVDAGPRLSMRVRNNVRVHVDWRQRLVGNARPGSGPAVTLAGDF